MWVKWIIGKKKMLKRAKKKKDTSNTNKCQNKRRTARRIPRETM